MSRRDGNSSSQSVGALLKELSQCCRSSGSLSKDGVREIIERHNCANNNDQNIDYYQFFRRACRNERVTEGILRYLLEYFPYAARHASERGQLPLHFICHHKNVTLGLVQLLIDAFPDSLHHEDNNGLMPLHALCLNKNLEDEVGLEILKLLVEKSPESVRHPTNRGGLPIHIAARYQSPEFCRILIEAYPGSERVTGDYG